MMQPRIEILGETILAGKKLPMSFSNNKTMALWQSFMPAKAAIKNVAGPELYSVEVYGDTGFFRNFDTTKEFEKWAAISVTDAGGIAEGMELLIIPQGEYAVFTYKGTPSEAMDAYKYIHAQWIPASEYELDNRPHFALMGEKYKGESPDSEEELWVPVRKKR